MKSKTLAALAVAGLFTSYGALADSGTAAYGHVEYGMAGNSVTIGSQLPPNVSEAPPAMTTIQSLDTRTGGYKGWGPMANLATPSSVSESVPSQAYFEQKATQQQQLAEVQQVRDRVWVANAPLRAEYENIGATNSRAGGFGSFFSRDKH
jgi:hypothetical protein